MTLLSATTLQDRNDGTVVELDPGWDIWGPAGGYIGAIALRAAGEKADPGHRPLTLTGQFARVAKPGFLNVDVQQIKAGPSSLFFVTLSQEGRPVFTSQIWTSLRAEPSQPIQPEAPNVPPPNGLRDHGQILSERGLKESSFWKNLEARPVNGRWCDDPPAADQRHLRWLRFRDWRQSQDPFIDGMRSVLLIDIGVWPAHWHRLAEEVSYLAPSLDLTVWFHGGSEPGDWLLSEADADVSGSGSLSGKVRIWSQDGRPIATGGGHCLVTRRKGS